ncbi:hypothetical protein EYF80_034301 [Liparis tanakae]|uniref:Uncharacterized protein n=1 Tax=Liparis tanakae TaxID=230148 RepID=A0A4Z2GQ43_9TELE|nr:hypothetical protein EYF80_034301 [Liparis tanakae]
MERVTVRKRKAVADFAEVAPVAAGLAGYEVTHRNCRHRANVSWPYTPDHLTPGWSLEFILLSSERSAFWVRWFWLELPRPNQRAQSFKKPAKEQIDSLIMSAAWTFYDPPGDRTPVQAAK